MFLSLSEQAYEKADKTALLLIRAELNLLAVQNRERAAEQALGFSGKMRGFVQKILQMVGGVANLDDCSVTYTQVCVRTQRMSCGILTNVMHMND